MLKTLFIRNYALIDELTLAFSGGLVIITGETGAGKSIIIDALGLVLGTRASTDEIRAGAEKAIVEGTFSTTGNKALKLLFQQHELEFGDELIVRREISARGQSRCFINDSPATLAILKEVGEHLVDLHGQHEHQSLLRPQTHVGMLDEFGGLEKWRSEYRMALEKFKEIATEVNALKRRAQHLGEKLELHAFQIKEIDAVNPQPGEEDTLESELRILENAETLHGSTTKLYELLYEGDQSVRDQLVLVRNLLHDLAAIDKEFEGAVSESASAEAIVGELAKFIQRYNGTIEFNPERLEAIRQRLGHLTLLKKKYGGSVEAIIAHREQIGREVSLAENFEDLLKKLHTELDERRVLCATLARRLSVKRHEVARKLEKAIVVELAQLGIPSATFAVSIQQREATQSNGNGEETAMYFMSGTQRVGLGPEGCDTVEFHISTNRGEEPKPLARVASGGEISRIMLALKSILAASDRTPVLIFDEIDSGVSGRIAQTVGMSMKALSAHHQVIAITHLPQIAGLADAHFVVKKTEDGKRARTTMQLLSPDERIHEVAKLMSGAQVTEAGLAGAKELMGVR
ncbi:MAG: DNA repair protein RecN [Bacteroidota bacterium]